MAKIIYWYEHRPKRKSKNESEKDFFQLMNKIVYRKAKENVGKLVATKRRWNYLISQPNYLLAIEIRKTKILVNKPVYLGLSILEL